MLNVTYIHKILYMNKILFFRIKYVNSYLFTCIHGASCIVDQLAFKQSRGFKSNQNTQAYIYIYVYMYVALVKTSYCYSIIINCTKCNHF